MTSDAACSTLRPLISKSLQITSFHPNRGVPTGYRPSISAFIILLTCFSLPIFSTWPKPLQSSAPQLQGDRWLAQSISERRPISLQLYFLACPSRTHQVFFFCSCHSREQLSFFNFEHSMTSTLKKKTIKNFPYISQVSKTKAFKNL